MTRGKRNEMKENVDLGKVGIDNKTGRKKKKIVLEVACVFVS